MDVRGKKIFVGLSGGVDSAVSAALLQQAGAEVTGVFIKGWYPPDMPCTWAEERRDAMRVAAHLHIPFYTLDAQVEYKKSVIDYLLGEYRLGRTPNPDVMCNKEVKFGAFYRFAKNAGADAIATGHYTSGEKDQRYFLWAVPKEILDTTLFPVGKKEKTEVRMLAEDFELPVAKKHDSQGVCFLGAISVEEFLKKEFGEHSGTAFDEKGKRVGTHKGALLYTLGERVALSDATEQGPWFVLSKDIEGNRLSVGKERVPQTKPLATHINFNHTNWLLDPARVTEAQYRYRGMRVPGSVTENVFMSSVPLTEIPTPGQSVVFYANDTLAGGGTIIV